MALEVAFHSNDFSNNANRYIQVRAGDSVGILLPNATGTETNGVPSNGILDNRTPPASRLRHTDLVQFQTSLIPSVPSNFLPIVFLSCPIYAQSGHTIILPPAIYITRNINNSIVSRNRPVIGGPGRIIIGLNYARSSQYNVNQYYPSTHNIPELSGSLIENDGIPVVGYNGGTVVVINNVVDSSRNSMNPPSRPSFGTYTGSALGYSPGILNRMIIRGAKILFANCSGNHGDRYASGQPSSPFDSNPIDAKDVVFQTLPSYTVGTSTVSEGRIRHMSNSSVFERVTYFNAGILMGQQPYTYSAISLLGQTSNIYFQHGGAFSPLIYSIEGDLETRDPSTQGFGLSLHRNNTSETISNIQRRSVGHVVFHRNTSATVGDEIYHPYVFYRSDNEAMTSSQRANFIRLGTVVQENKYNLRLSTTSNNYLNSSASMSAIALPTANTSRGLSPIRYKVKASSNLRFTTSVNSDRDLLRIKSVQYNVGGLQNDDLVRTFDWRSAFGEYGSISEVPALNINAIANRYVKVEADPAGATANFAPYDSPVYRIDGSTPITPASSTQSARRSELNLNALEGSTLSGNLDQVRLNGMILTLLKEDMHTDNTRTLTITVSSGNLNLALPSGTNWNTEMRVQSATQLLDRYFAIEAYTMGSAVAINAVNTGVGFEVVSVNNHNLVLRGKAGVTHVAQNALTRVRVYIPLSVDATATLNFKIAGVSNTEFSVEAVGADAADFNWLHYFGYTNSYYLEDKVFAMELTQGRSGATVPLNDANQVEGLDFLRLESPTKIFFSNRLNQGFTVFNQDNVDNMTIRITNSASDTETYPMASRWRMDGTSSSRLGLARVNDGGDDDLWGLRLPVEIKETFSRHFIPGTRFRLRVGQAHAQTVAHQKNEIDDIFEIERTTSAITGVGDARAAEITFFFRALMGKGVNPTPSSSITRGLTDWTVEFYLDSASHPFALRKRVSFDSDQTNQLFETQIIKSVNETSVYQGFQNIIIDGGGTTTQEIRESRMERNYRSPCNSVTVNFAPSTRTVTLTFSFLVLHGVYDNDLRALYKVAGTKGQRRPGLSHHNQETKILIGGIDPSLTAVRALNGVHDITAVTRNTISFVLPSGQTVTDGTNILTNTTANTLSAGFGHANVWDERTWDVTVQAQGYDDLNYSLSPAQLDGEVSQSFLMNRNRAISTSNLGDPNVIDSLATMVRAIENLETRIGRKLIEIVQDGGGNPNFNNTVVTASTAGIMDVFSGALFTYDIEFRKEAHRTTGTQRAGAELVDNRIVIYSNIAASTRLTTADTQNIFSLATSDNTESLTVTRLICGQLTTPDETANSGANSIRIPTTGAINPAFIGDSPTKFLNFALHETRAGSDGKYITPIIVIAPGELQASRYTSRADISGANRIKLIASFYEAGEGTYGKPTFAVPAYQGNTIGSKVYHGRVSGNSGSVLGVGIFLPDRYLLKRIKYIPVSQSRYFVSGRVNIANINISSEGLSPNVSFTLDDFIDSIEASTSSHPSASLLLPQDNFGLESASIADIFESLTRILTTTRTYIEPSFYTITTNNHGQATQTYDVSFYVNPAIDGAILNRPSTIVSSVGLGVTELAPAPIVIKYSGTFMRGILSSERLGNTVEAIKPRTTSNILVTTTRLSNVLYLVFRFRLNASDSNARNASGNITVSTPTAINRTTNPLRVYMQVPRINYKTAAINSVNNGRFLIDKLTLLSFRKTRSVTEVSDITDGNSIVNSVISSSATPNGIININSSLIVVNTGAVNVVASYGITTTRSPDQIPDDIIISGPFSAAGQFVTTLDMDTNITFIRSEAITVRYYSTPRLSSDRTATPGPSGIINILRVRSSGYVRISFPSFVSSFAVFYRLIITRQGYYPRIYEVAINTSRLITVSLDNARLDMVETVIPSNVSVSITNQILTGGNTLQANPDFLAVLFTVTGSSVLTERQFNEIITTSVFNLTAYANLALRRNQARLIEFDSGEVSAYTGVRFILDAPVGSNPGFLRVRTYVPDDPHVPERTFGTGPTAVTSAIVFNTTQDIVGSGGVTNFYNRISPDINDLRNRIRRIEGSVPEGHGMPRLESDEPFILGIGATEVPRSNFTSTTGYNVPSGYGQSSDLVASSNNLEFTIDETITSQTTRGFETNPALAGNITFHPRSGDSIHLALSFRLNSTANTPISTAIEAVIVQIELITEVQIRRSVAKVIAIGEHATRTTTNLIDTNIPIGSEQNILGNMYSFRVLVTQIIPRGFTATPAGREALQDADRMGRVFANDYSFGTGSSLTLSFRTIEIRRLMQPDLFEQTATNIQQIEGDVWDVKSTLPSLATRNNYTETYNPTFSTTNSRVSANSGAVLTIREVSTVDNILLTIGDLTTTAIVLDLTLTASYPVVQGDRIRLRMKGEGALTVNNISFSMSVVIFASSVRYTLPLRYITLPRRDMTDETYTDIYFNLGYILRDIGSREYNNIQITIDFTHAPDQPDDTDQILLLIQSMVLQRVNIPEVSTLDKVETMLTPQMADDSMYAISTNAAENISGGGGGSISGDRGTALDRLFAMTTGTGVAAKFSSDALDNSINANRRTALDRLHSMTAGSGVGTSNSNAAFREQAFLSILDSNARGNLSDVVNKLDALSAQDITDLKQMVDDTHDLGSSFWDKLADMGDEWDNMIQDNTVSSTTYQRFKAQALEALFSNGQDTTFGTTGSVLRQVVTRLNTMIGLMMGSTAVYQFNANALALAPTGSGGGGTTLTSDQTGALDSLHAMISSNQFTPDALTNALTTAQKAVFTNLTGMIMGTGGSASFKSTAIPAISVGRVQLSTANETLMTRLNSMTSGSGGNATFMPQAFNNLGAVAVSGTVRLSSVLETTITRLRSLIEASTIPNQYEFKRLAFANLPPVTVTGTVNLEAGEDGIINKLGTFMDSTSFKASAIPNVNVAGLGNAVMLDTVVTALNMMITNNTFNKTAFADLYELMFLLSGLYHKVTGSNTGTQLVRLFKNASDLAADTSQNNSSTIEQTVTRSLDSGLLSGQSARLTKSLITKWTP